MIALAARLSFTLFFLLFMTSNIVIESLETEDNNNDAPPQMCIAIPGSHRGSRTRGGESIISSFFKSSYDPNIWSDPEYVCTLAKYSHFNPNIKNLQSGVGANLSVGFDTKQQQHQSSSENIVLDEATWQFLDRYTGKRQRIDGSVSEKMAVRRVLQQMEYYFRTEVLSRPEYSTIRDKCHNYNELCAFWTSVGECESNRGFMLLNCAASCRLCLHLYTNFNTS